jgi:tetratricopeptide (TPR) repeat protein
MAREARALAESQALAAKTEQARAELRLTELIELSDRTLYDVHSAIETLPGATNARRQIVSTTLAFLENLSKDAGQDDRLRFALSVSYSKVAAVLGYPMRPNLGDSRGALENYRRSIDLVESLIAASPNNPDYLRQWLDAQTDWAAVAARTGDNSRAVAVLRGLLPTSRRLPALCPDVPACLMAEGMVSSELADVLNSTDTSAALAYAQLSTRSGERALRAFPDDTHVLLELATACSQEARLWNSRGELAKASRQYQRAIELREGALKRDPSDVLTRRSLMITYGNLGGNLGSPLFPNLGDSVGAREYYGKALAIARELAKADASNQLAQYDLANALAFNAILDLPKDDWPASLAMLREADAILQRLIAADPQSLSKSNASALVEEYEGRRLEGLGQLDAAIDVYRRSIAAAEQALGRAPSNMTLLVQLSASEGALAEVLARRSDATALRTIRRTIDRAEHFTVPDSDRDKVRRCLAGAFRSLAIVHAALGHWSDALVSARRAVAEYRDLVAGGTRINARDIAEAEALVEDCLAHQK